MKTVTLALARMQSIRQLHKYLRAELERRIITVKIWTHCMIV